jgi:uncharacterized tellurite resistance protein B-like protein
MNIEEAGYEILVLLALSDHNLHDKEIKQIKKFINAQFYTKDVNYRPLVQIERLTIEDRLNRLVELADFLKNTKEKNKNILINFALDLVISDRKLHKNEEPRFKIVAQAWGIDLDKHIKERLESIK